MNSVTRRGEYPMEPRQNRIIRRHHRSVRRGAAVVEMAVVTPLLLMMMFGIMEFGWEFMMKETLTNATREAARVMVLKGATTDDAKARFASAISGTGLSVGSNELTITSSPLTIAGSSSDTLWTVTASVPRSKVSLFGLTTALQNMMHHFKPSSSLSTNNMVATCSMRAET
jgi:Flp pilus assembly protein TadG